MTRKKMHRVKAVPQETAAAKDQSKIVKFVSAAYAHKFFAAFSMVILAFTTIFWAVLSAKSHEVNADQFIDAYLFESKDTFTSALFPGAHTFLIKWPLFALMRTFGHGAEVFMVATVLMVLATVGALVYIMHRIERRPLVFGLLCLTLASVLLLIPAQPYPGAALPTNFAMTTTRNLEYVLFVVCALFVARGLGIRTVAFWLLAGVMAFVIASDKLFAVLALGSAVIVLVGYIGILRRRQEKVFALNWLWLGIAATVLGQIILWAISALGITNVVNETQASPFPVIQSAKQLAEGLIYGAGSVLTNFGANPVHDVVIIRDIPSAFVSSFSSPTIFAYLFNAAALVFALYATYKVIASGGRDTATRLTTLLAAATLIALAVFVLTDHYYPVDARYVAIELFALFIALATYIKHKTIRLRYTAALAAALLFIILPLGMVRSWQEFSASESSRSAFISITTRVADIVDGDKISRLIGNYWDITPVKPQTKNNVTIAPVDNCTHPQTVLNSLSWFKQQSAIPSAFLAIRDQGKSTYDGCSLARLATQYGTPTKRVLLAANPEPPYDPDALLLVYANGPQPLEVKKADVTTVPVPVARKVTPLTERTTCKGMSLNVVAHQDDDLLFMNPDVADDIRAGRCIRTVYLTAGDAGETSAYWNSRELGAKAAYAKMYNLPNTWQDDRQLLNDRFVAVSTLENAPGVQLIFLRLPDGNLRGEGFAGTRNQSIQSLLSAQLASLRTVDDDTEYDRQQLIDTLREILKLDKPDVIRTQGADDPTAGDHSDHHAAGSLVKLATDGSEHFVMQYGGYPVMHQPVNLLEPSIAAKHDAFLAYARYDGAVCQSVAECAQMITYGSYLTRQYKTGQAVTPELTAAP